MIAVQLISLVSLGATTGAFTAEKDNKCLTTQGIYEVGKKQNVIVIILDRLDDRYIEEVLADDPQFFKRLDGFTRFTNSISAYTRTWPAVANMITGKVTLFDQPKAEFLKQAWQGAQMVKDLKAGGFSTKFYTDQGYAFQTPADLEGIADNLGNVSVEIQMIPTIKIFLQLSAYRYVPHVMKATFWTSTDKFNRDVIDTNMDPAPYMVDDFLFYDGLKSKRLTLAEDDNAFAFIHLNGPHPPFNMGEQGERLAGENASSYLRQTKGSFQIVYEYLDQLKALGLYKNSTIIITGDHGEMILNDGPLEAPILTGLFVKPAGSAEIPLKQSSAPVSSDNLRATVLAGAGLDYSDYGLTFFEIPEDAHIVRKLYYMIDSSEPRLDIYEVDGDAHYFSNWHKTDELPVKQENLIWYGLLQ